MFKRNVPAPSRYIPEKIANWLPSFQFTDTSPPSTTIVILMIFLILFLLAAFRLVQTPFSSFPPKEKYLDNISL